MRPNSEPGTWCRAFFVAARETMANANVVQERKTQVISIVPLSVREQVDKLARREQVSVSEIGRRALSEYVQKQKV
jgi:hypothetical protein